MIPVIPTGLEPVTYALGRGQIPRDSKRIEADPSDQARAEDAILCELLNAQAVWLATRDPAALRRKLIEMLAALG
jgi:hypothetical protein